MTLFSYCDRCGCRNDQSHYSNCTANDAPAETDNGWRPIETAPKDGVPVLIFQGNRSLNTIAVDDPGIAVGMWRIGGQGWYGVTGAGICLMQPTHWHQLPPLPTPPSVACVPSTNQEP